MDEQFLTPSRLKILREIANRPKSVSEIARKLEMSIPYILNQVVLMEAKGIIKKEQIKEKKPGKPRKQYRIVEPDIRITVVSQEFTNQFDLLNPTSELIDYFKSISFINKKKQAEFSKYYWEEEFNLKKLEALGLIEVTDEKVELLAITTSEHLDFLRKKIAHKIISLNNKKTTFVCWVHTIEEIEEGLRKNDFYYQNLKQKVVGMNDPKGLFKKIKGV